MRSSGETNAAIRLALGRIFRLAARPSKPGDIAEYERCRALVLDLTDPAMIEAAVIDRRPNYARDWRGGAAGD